MSTLIVIDVVARRPVATCAKPAIAFHLSEGLIGCPAIVRHAIDCRHLTRAMPPPSTMDVDRPVLRVVDQFQEVGCLLICCPTMTREWYHKILHVSGTHPDCLFRNPILLQ